MDPRLLLPLAAALLAALLFFEVKGRRKARAIFKTTLSAIFVAAAALQPAVHSPFFWLVVAGLVLCMIGDLLLALPGDRTFLGGLAAFLLGHVAYAAAFFTLADLNVVTLWGAIPTVIVSAAIFAKLRPRLGKMLLPVAVYVTMITLMVIGAWTVLGDSDLQAVGRGLVLAGALIFYLSDFFVARQRFVERRLSNPLVGLPLYYVAQFLLAFSLGRLP